MIGSRVAFRFAKALLNFSIESGEVDQVYEDMVLVGNTCAESRDLRNLFTSPVVKTDKKRKIFRSIFGEKITKTSHTYCDIIFRRGREEVLVDIANSFVSQYKEFRKIHIVYVETAKALSEDNRKEVMRILSKQSADGFELVEKVDEGLIGGIILRLRDLQLDASVRNSLNKLKKEYSKEIYTPKY